MQDPFGQTQPQAQAEKPSWANMQESGNPVQEFKGKLAGYTTKAEYNNVFIYFSFSEVQVIKSRTPYLLPVLEIRMKLSNSDNSGWGKLGDSLANVMNVPRASIDIDSINGRMQHWKASEGYEFFKDNEGKPATGTIWEVLTIEGCPGTHTPIMEQSTASPSINPAPANPTAPAINPLHHHVLINCINGRNEMDGWQAALADETVKTNPDLLQSILNKTFVSGYKQAGVIQVDASGIHHVVGI